MLVDTHCHIQSISGESGGHTSRKWRDGGITNADEVVDEAKAAGVNRLICVGTDLENSQKAVNFVTNRKNCWASAGIHPHEAAGVDAPRLESLERVVQSSEKVVAIGEVGLDYYYEHSPKAEQIKLLEQLLNLAQKSGLPVIFHVREAYDDFWPIYDNFKGLSGVLHSFSSDVDNLEKALKRGLYIGLNGIMTFTKDEAQLAAAKAAPIDNILLETDAPYLTPAPFRGKVCQPKHIKTICEFLCALRGGSFDEFAARTTQNAKNLFNIT